jgi:hypothetical protein
MRGLWRFLLIAGLAAPVRAEPPDPLAQAVIDSLAFPERTTPVPLFDAVVKATKVDAYDVAASYLRRFDAALAAAGDRRPDILADLGDAHDDGTLLATVRRLSPTEPAIAKVVRDIQTASRLRRRDPKRLAEAIADLTSDSFARRTEAGRRLSLAGLDAIGPIVGWLNDPRHADGDDEPTARGRGVVRELLRGLGEDGVVALLGWLGTPDVDNWPGIISAIDLAGPPPERVRPFLLAPVAVVDTPPEARRRAAAAIERAGGRLPTRGAAAAELDRRLDAVLCSEDADATRAGAHAAPAADTTEEITFWDAEKRVAGRARLTPRQRKSLEAAHLARDRAALGELDAASERLVLLARLEATLLVVDRADASAGERIVAAVSSAEGPSATTIASVLDEAMQRGMAEAAEAAATVIAEIAGSPPRPMEPAVRRSLVRALSAPDLAVRFAAARAVAIAGPRGLYAGQSRVVETLLDCATSTGVVRAVVVHPIAGPRQELAAAVAALGYAPTTVVRGRDAVVETRDSCDVRLVVIGANLGPPGAHETAEFLSWIPTDGPLRVVVVHDEADLADVAPVGEDDRRRAAERLARAGESLRLLASIARDGEDVAAALPVALSAIDEPSLAPRAIDLLSKIGRPEAQAAVHAVVVRPNASDDLRERAIAAFRESVGRYGILLETCDISEEYRRYNTATDAAGRRWSGLVLDILESPPTAARTPTADASNPR